MGHCKAGERRLQNVRQRKALDCFCVCAVNTFADEVAYFADVLIRQLIDHFVAVPLIFDNAHVAQGAQLAETSD
ncbi:MAG: hypothetical protein MZU84_07075 [Sphingobacterium sp.]|nr:hypothetical protein [Sphingobacterium sp.]